MSTTDLEKAAQALVANGKGILAADETVPTVTKRLAALMIESTPDSRRAYREMFFTTPGVAAFGGRDRHAALSSPHVPAVVPGIVVLSGGQDHFRATTHLSEINQLQGPKPWTLSFSYG